MELRRLDDLEAFYRRAEPWLLEREVENNFILSLAGGMLHHPERFRAQPLLIVIEDQGRPLGVAMRSDPRRPLVSSELPAGALELLAAQHNAGKLAFSALFAPNATALELVRLATAHDGKPWRVKMRLGLYSLDEPPARANGATGELRLAVEADLPLVSNWYVAFCREAMRDDPIPDPELLMRRRIQDGTVHLWNDGEPVTMVMSSERTPNGVRINGVFTPRELRRRGYATSSVAEVSRRCLARGARFCCLYTDLANPTSNSIYAKVGYRPRGEHVQMERAG